MTWATFDVWGDDDANGPEQVHVIPTYEEHDVSVDCWCGPRGDEGVFVHRDKLDRDPPGCEEPVTTDAGDAANGPSVPDQSHIEYRTRGPRWNGTPYLSLASAQHELTALLPGRYRIEQRTVTTTEWRPLAAADREAPERCASCGGPDGHLGACTTWTPPVSDEQEVPDA